MEKPNFHIVLHAPEIPGNTGSIGRTCVALNLKLILIRPYGFELSEKAVRRAGLDYWKYVNLTEYDNFKNFLQEERPEKDELFFFENDASKSFYQAPFKKNCYLIFGGETKGIPQDILEHYPEQNFYLPMFSKHIRSLNLSNTATAAAYECLRHIQMPELP